MSTLQEIEAAAAKLPQEQQNQLIDFLMRRAHTSAVQNSTPHSILDIPVVSLGGMILQPDDEDLLAEMVEGRS